jgi:hypothetical protein
MATLRLSEEQNLARIIEMGQINTKETKFFSISESFQKRIGQWNEM